MNHVTLVEVESVTCDEFGCEEEPTTIPPPTIFDKRGGEISGVAPTTGAAVVVTVEVVVVVWVGPAVPVNAAAEVRVEIGSFEYGAKSGVRFKDEEDGAPMKEETDG